MNKRGNWQGMFSIARFNWPFFVLASGIFLIGVTALAAGGILAMAGIPVILGCLWFLLGALGVSHWVYDRSDLYRWTWLNRVLKDTSTDSMVICHSGFDEVSAMLRWKFPESRWQVLDHYDPAIMTEASIRRARQLFPPLPGTVTALFNQWPVENFSVNVIFGLLAIHELRTETERAAWFAEARRCLMGDGKVVIAEHVRDGANFVAFGPGFMHFHTADSWRRSWESGGLTLDSTFRITPFVRVFVLKLS